MGERVKQLLKSVSAAETRLLETEFLAPCVPGGRVRARVQGLIYTFAPIPRDFEGWGIFVPLNQKEAQVLEEADLPLVAGYMKLLTRIRLRLSRRLHNHTWLAYPVNESDAGRRFGEARPVAVHIVTDGAQFEQVVSRWDGQAFWFEDIDRRAEPSISERLRDALNQNTSSEQLTFSGITPEMRAAYQLATGTLRWDNKRPKKSVQRHNARRNKPVSDEERLQDALRMAGGELRGFLDRAGYWTVEWVGRDGQRHTSAIAKDDLTVISSGICLSGRDRDFDLTSLVGVMEGY